MGIPLFIYLDSISVALKRFKKIKTENSFITCQQNLTNKRNSNLESYYHAPAFYALSSSPSMCTMAEV